MKKTILLFSIIIGAITAAKAQTYNTAVGAKFYVGNGTLGGFNIKHTLTTNTAAEGSLLFGNNAIAIEGLYQYQGDITEAPGLQYFVGGGALIGFGTGKGSSTVFALRLTGGLDYKLPEVPIDVSLGLDPFFNIVPGTNSSLTLGLGFRYILP